MQNSRPRKIIHIDADAFYASVEIRENPSLATQPVAVGGAPGKRGVIATCNYIARQYGIHSAMASSHALKLCPELVFVTPNFSLYKAISKQMRQIMCRYTELIEPLSLDEAYLDVSYSDKLEGSATRIAEAIRHEIKNELNLCVSAGVAPNKFLAKVASDWKKPDGLFVIKPDQVQGFVNSLPVNKINGVGKVTTQKLNNLGIHTCGDLQTKEETFLAEKFGRYGTRLFQVARGIDERPVQTSRIRKSLSVEHTFSQDLKSLQDIQSNAQVVFNELCERSSKLNSETRIHKRFVKIKFSDFTQTTLEEICSQAPEIYEQSWQDLNAYSKMLNEAWKRKERPVRLLGMGIRLLPPKKSGDQKQLSLFET